MVRPLRLSTTFLARSDNALRRTSLLPSGPSDAPLKDIISVHLHNSSLGGGWHACAKFVLVISNPHNPTIYNVARTWSAIRSVTKLSALHSQMDITGLLLKRITGLRPSLAIYPNCPNLNPVTIARRSRGIPQWSRFI